MCVLLSSLFVQLPCCMCTDRSCGAVHVLTARDGVLEQGKQQGSIFSLCSGDSSCRAGSSLPAQTHTDLLWQKPTWPGHKSGFLPKPGTGLSSFNRSSVSILVVTRINSGNEHCSVTQIFIPTPSPLVLGGVSTQEPLLLTTITHLAATWQARSPGTLEANGLTAAVKWLRLNSNGILRRSRIRWALRTIWWNPNGRFPKRTEPTVLTFCHT